MLSEVSCDHKDCNNEAQSDGCFAFQRSQGCHACGKTGCWNSSPLCPYAKFRGRREDHADASLGDSVPHMREIETRCVADGVSVALRKQEVNWWMKHNAVHFYVNARWFRMGQASGKGCNCLIDTIRQSLSAVCDVMLVRHALEERHPDIIHGDYLELQRHWRDIIEFVGI